MGEVLPQLGQAVAVVGALRVAAHLRIIFLNLNLGAKFKSHHLLSGQIDELRLELHGLAHVSLGTLSWGS